MPIGGWAVSWVWAVSMEHRWMPLRRPNFEINRMVMDGGQYHSGFFLLSFWTPVLLRM